MSRNDRGTPADATACPCKDWNERLHQLDWQVFYEPGRGTVCICRAFPYGCAPEQPGQEHGASGPRSLDVPPPSVDKSGPAIPK